MKTIHLKRTDPPGKSSTFLAIASFGLGTIILLLHSIFPEKESVMTAGLFYLITAVLLNGIFLFNLLYHFASQPAHREIVAIRILILVSNIPIALLYLKITFNK